MQLKIKNKVENDLSLTKYKLTKIKEVFPTGEIIYIWLFDTLGTYLFILLIENEYFLLPFKSI